MKAHIQSGLTAAVVLSVAFVVVQTASIRSHQTAYGSLSEPIDLTITNLYSMPTVLTTTFCWTDGDVISSTTVTTTQEKGETAKELSVRHNADVAAAKDGKTLVTCP